jgi:hypothetical protein
MKVAMRCAPAVAEFDPDQGHSTNVQADLNGACLTRNSLIALFFVISACAGITLVFGLK